MCKCQLILPGNEHDGDAVVGDEAHIVGRSVGGPRSGCPLNTDVDAYENLVLLCKIHHKVVDDQPLTYTVDVLLRLKAEHEKWAEGRFNMESGDATEATPVGQRVPRSGKELKVLRANRPPGWEHLSYAGHLIVGLQDLATKRFRAKFGIDRHRRSLPSPAIAARYLGSAIHHAANMDELNRWTAKDVISHALGYAGHQPQPKVIKHVARGLLSTYEHWLDQAIKIRSVQPPDILSRAYELAVQLLEQPVQQFEEFVFDLVEQFDRIPAHLNGPPSDEPLHLEVVLALAIDEALVAECEKALHEAVASQSR